MGSKRFLLDNAWYLHFDEIPYRIDPGGPLTTLNSASPKNVLAPNRVEDLRGWLPIDAVVYDGRPGIVLMDMRGVELIEPFFHQSVDRFRAETSDMKECLTDLDALIQLEKITSSLVPAGFIFHSSRCGSTTVTNALKKIDGAIVIAEAPVLDKLIGRFFTDADSAVKEALYSVFLRGAVAAFGQPRSANERHLIIKFSCQSVGQLDRILRIWPNVPWLFLYRDPLETIVSNIEVMPDWLLGKADARILSAIAGADERERPTMCLEELCARAIGSFYDTAQRLANDKCLLLNYNELSIRAVERIAEFFKLSISDHELAAIELSLRNYSKDSSREFTDDSEAKQSTASPLIRKLVSKWAANSYRVLDQKKLARSAASIEQFQ
ncbi:MAG: hypothetical protein ABR555_00840 [Pyrinomonadaceae bacterium]